MYKYPIKTIHTQPILFPIPNTNQKNKKLLQVFNLKPWVKNEKLQILCDSEKVEWLHRETETTAYIYFKDTKSASICLSRLQNKKFIYKGSLAINNPLTIDMTTIQVQYASDYIESRFFHLLNMISESNSSTSYLKIFCSARLNMSEWYKLIPEAYDIYKLTDQSKVFVEFLNIETAKFYKDKLDKQTFIINTVSGTIHIATRAVFTTKELLEKKSYIFGSSSYYNRCKEEEQMYSKVVDWLYKEDN